MDYFVFSTNKKVKTLSVLTLSMMVGAFLGVNAFAFNSGDPASLDVKAIEKSIGKKGQFGKDNSVFKITVPRDDLNIVINGMKITPNMGLTSWVTFKKVDDQTTVIGDLILLQDQVNPVMSVVLENNLEVTDLHSPFLWDSPRVLLMHIKGQGDEHKLAPSLKKIFAAIQATSDGRGDYPLFNLSEIKTTLHPQRISSILGVKGSYKDGMYKIVLGSGDKTNKAWAAFSGSDEEAVVEGSVAVYSSQLYKTLSLLRKDQIYVTAIYQYPTNEDANVVLVHYWGIGQTFKLAKTLQGILAVTKEKPMPEEQPKQMVNNPMEQPVVQVPEYDFSIKWDKQKFPGLSIAEIKTKPQYLAFVSESISIVKRKFYASIQSIHLLAGNVMHSFPSFSTSLRVKQVSNSEVHATPKQVSSNIQHEPEVKAPNYFLQYALLAQHKNFTYARMVAHATPVMVSDVQNADIVNLDKLTQHLHVAFNVRIIEQNNGNALLHGLLATQHKNYDYPAILSASNPVVFPTEIDHGVRNLELLAKHLAFAMQINNASDIASDNRLLRELLSAQRKNYDYPTILSVAHPVMFPAEMDHGIKNLELLTKHLASVMQMNVMDSSDMSSNFFLRQVLKTQHRNYDYASVVSQANPVMFPTEVDHSIKNYELLTKHLAAVMGVRTLDTAEMSSNYFLGLLLKTQHKSYDYMLALLRMHPVVFTAEVRAMRNVTLLTKYLAAAFQVKNNVPDGSSDVLLQRLVSAQNLNFNYAEKIMKSAPVRFPPERQMIVKVQDNNFKNTEKLTKFLASALLVKHESVTDKIPMGLLRDLLMAQNKDFSYINVFNKSITDATPAYVEPKQHVKKEIIPPSPKPIIAYNNKSYMDERARLSKEAIHQKKLGSNEKFPVYIVNKSGHLVLANPSNYPQLFQNKHLAKSKDIIKNKDLVKNKELVKNNDLVKNTELVKHKDLAKNKVSKSWQLTIPSKSIVAEKKQMKSKPVFVAKNVAQPHKNPVVIKKHDTDWFVAMSKNQKINKQEKKLAKKQSEVIYQAEAKHYEAPHAPAEELYPFDGVPAF